MALSFPQSDVVQNKNLSATGAVNSGKAFFYGCVLTGGADAASATFYDNTAGSGTKLLTVKAGINTTIVAVCPAVRCGTGIYAVVTGTTPELNAFYVALS